MAVFEVQLLAPEPSAAAAQFYSQYLPLIRVQLDAVREPLTILFPQADYAHAAWRLAAVQSLAGEAAPQRVNAASGGHDAARLAAVHYLDNADGVTGQLLQLDDAGAGPVVECAR